MNSSYRKASLPCAVLSVCAVCLGLLCICPAFLAAPALSEEVVCLSCHEDLKKEKVLHPAVEMGCPTCHSAIDAKDVPHKKTNAVAKGLSAGQPDLCYNCHDKAMFTKKVVHPAVAMGCTGCHNPHSSKNAKLLVAEQPELCFTCHDKADFTKKNVHMPVAGGDCIGCHNPHASDFEAMLKDEPLKVCLNCHGEIKEKPHAIAGFSAKGHPLGEPKGGKIPDDPARKGKKFYCGSCHDQHSSDYGKLFRYKGSAAFDLCGNCHKL